MTDEQVPEVPRNRISRRTVLKRVGAGAAIAWTAPVIASIRVPAFAQAEGSPLCDACVATTIDPPGPPGPITTHRNFVATAECCDCIAANPDPLDFIINCLGRVCQPLPGGPQPGPCP